MAADLHIIMNGTPTPLYLGENTTVALNMATRAETAQTAAEAAQAAAEDAAAIIEPNPIKASPMWLFTDEDGDLGWFVTEDKFRHPAIDALRTDVDAIGGIVSTSIAWYGDSLSDGYDGLTPPLTFLSTALSRTGNRFAIPGQASAQIASRQGGHLRTLTLDSNQIVIGSNSVTEIDSETIAHWEGLSTGRKTGALFLSTPGNATTYSAEGWLDAIHGTLTRTRPGGVEVYTFTPDSDFDALLPLTITADTPFIVDTDAYEGDLLVAWLGTNDVPATGAGGTAFTAFKDAVKAEIALMVERCSHKRFIVLGVLNRGDQPSSGTGSDCYAAIAELNADLAALYPASFIDVRKGLIQRGLALQEITATAQDTTDIGNDVVPDSLRSDTLHLNDDGYEAVSKIVQERLEAKGW